jgi:hypothetical protein
MTLPDLLLLLVALPPINDWHGHPIPRDSATVHAIATAALEHPEADPILLAATLDVLAAHESGYHVNAIGDHGRSIGTWQTPRSQTPSDVLGQARLAAKWVLVSWAACPDHPLNPYATGRCVRSAIAEKYQGQVTAEYEAMVSHD